MLRRNILGVLVMVLTSAVTMFVSGCGSAGAAYGFDPTPALAHGFVITCDGASSSEDILVGDGGVTWYPVVTYRMLMSGEGGNLTDLYVMNVPSSRGMSPISTAADARVAVLGFFDGQGILKATSTLVGGRAHFALGPNRNDVGLGAMAVTTMGVTRVVIKAKLNTVKDANKTGALLRLALDPNGGTDGSGVRVVGDHSGLELLGSEMVAARSVDGSLRVTSTASDFFVLRRTKIAITQIAQVGSSETDLSDFTQKPVYRFTVSSNSNEDGSWKGVKFVVTGSLGSASLAMTTAEGGGYASSAPTGVLGFTVSDAVAWKYVRSFRLYDAATNQEVQNQNYTVQVGWNVVRGEGEVAIILNDGVEEVISAGTSKTYELRADVNGVAAGNNALNVRIRQEANDRRGAADLVAGTDPDEVDGVADGVVAMVYGSVGGAITPYSLLWSDNSGSPHSAANSDKKVLERDWTNDRFVRIDSAGWNRSNSF